MPGDMLKTATGKRLAAAQEVYAVLKPFGGKAAARAKDLRNLLESGRNPEPAQVSLILNDLLFALMDPGIKENDVTKMEGFLATTSGLFSRRPAHLPSRKQVRAAFKSLETAFGRGPATKT